MRPGKSRNRRAQSGAAPAPAAAGEWIFGRHAARAAFANPRRTILRALALPEAVAACAAAAAQRGVRLEASDPATFTQMFGEAVHQGIALLAQPLAPLTLDAVLAEAGAAPIVVLDQVTDPHNVGAILRSAAAFGALAVVVQDRHAPQLAGVVAKTASGAADITPLVRVVNISRALDDLKEAGFLVLGLAEEAETALDAARDTRPVALVLGSEGEGLRRLTRERCDRLVRLPTAPAFPSLNVSNAAAIALYAVTRR